MADDDTKLVLHRLDQQDRQLSRIEKHARETNGRVQSLELWKARVEGVLWLASGGGGKVAAVVAAVVSGVAVYVLTHVL